MTITRKKIFDILFYILIALMIIKPTRVYILRFLSLSPSIEKTENQITISSYNWQLKGINTNDVDFNSLKGKVVIVNFWATWCAPCLAEMPSLESLYKDYGDKVAFLLITNENPDVVIPFLKKKGYTAPIYIPTTQNPSELNTETIPKTFLIDKSGKIIIEAGRADWNSKKTRKLLDKLLIE